MRFRSPTAFAGRAALPGAAGNRAIPLRRFRPAPPSDPRLRFRRAPPRCACGVTIGAGGGTSASPLRFFACARVPRRRRVTVTRLLPQRQTFGRRFERVMHRRFLAGRCSATRASRRATWPGPSVVPAPAALMGFDPSRRCSRPRVSARLRASDPPAVSPAPLPTRVLCFESGGRMPSTHVFEGNRPRAPAAAPGLRPRVRSAPRASPLPRRHARPMPPWASPLSGFRGKSACHDDTATLDVPASSETRNADASLGHRFRPPPLVGLRSCQMEKDRRRKS